MFDALQCVPPMCAFGAQAEEKCPAEAAFTRHGAVARQMLADAASGAERRRTLRSRW